MNTIEKVSAGGVILRGKDVCVLYVPDYDEMVFPKGTIENGESPETASIREVLEETGYHVKIVEKLDSITYEFNEEGCHYKKTVHYYLMNLLNESEVPVPHLEGYEAFETRWLDARDALEMLTHDVNKKLLQKALTRISYA